MKKFKYKGILDNKKVKGVIEEETIEDAKIHLKTKGIKIIDINESISLFNNQKPLKINDISNICGQLALIINSGISLIKGLEVIIEETKDLKQKKVLNSVLTSVKKGTSLGKAMELTGAFPKLMTDMILSGELTGDVDTVLFNLETFYQREATIKSKVKTASIYPIVILLTTIAMLLFFDFFIYAKLKDLFLLSNNIPLITKILMFFLDFLNASFLRTLFIIIAIVLFVYYIKSKPKIRYYFDLLGLKIPFIKELRKQVITSRFVGSMYVFIKAGLPMIKIVESFDLILGNQYYITKLKGFKQEIITGGKIAEAISKLDLFDPIVIQMINVGEETGQLEESLNKLNKVYDKRIENTLSKLMSLVEPAFTLIIGLFVALIVIAVALPILDLSKGIK